MSLSDIRKDVAGKHKDLVVVERVVAALVEVAADVAAAAVSIEEMVLSVAVRPADA